MRFLLITIILLSTISVSTAQQRPVIISFVEGRFEGSSILTDNLDSATFQLKLVSLRNQLFSKGHLLANIDGVNLADSLSASIYVGPKYYWRSLGIKNVPEEYLSKAGYRFKDFNNKATDYKQFDRLMSKLLAQASGAGYPFASFRLANVTVLNNSVEGVLEFTPGPLIKYDTLTILPEKLVRADFIEAYLQINRGDLFNYEQVKNIESTLQKLPYAKLKDPVQLRFANNLCNISITLEKIKSNHFDAIIGFLPNQGSENGLRITGYADLHLDNLFRAGKSLTFQWQQFQPLSQNLRLNYKHPNLFKSPLGFAVEGNLIRQDSAFLNTNFTFDIFYARRRMEVALLSNFVSSRQLSNPADTISLPAIADYNMRLFGIDVRYVNMANPPNPRSGFSLGSSLQFGGRRLNKNPNLPEAVYDSVDISSNQLKFKINAEFNQGFSRLFALHANLQAGTVWNSNRLFLNDLLRLGGVQTLRGFNELEFFVSSYGLLRLEFRLLMSQESRLFLFYDQALTNNEISLTSDMPFGFGTGLELATRGGDLQLVYALGVSQEQSLSLDQSKIHLGYVATF